MSAVIYDKDIGFTERQKSEIDYHVGFAAQHRGLAEENANLDVCTSDTRRPWNAYWSLYDRVRGMDLRGKRVLIPGCGFGEDCLRIAQRGADVHGLDLSPDIVDIARARVARFAPGSITVQAMPCEQIDYPDGYFDAVMLVNILHHVDIPRTMKEVVRVTKPGGELLGLEMYTHSAAQRIRESKFSREILYPRVMRTIYGGVPYITPDERKLNEDELDFITGHLKGCESEYFCMLTDRLFSDSNVTLAKFDKALLRLAGGLGRYLAGRVVFSGQRI